ncbi:MAG TPA: hypothetical protein PLL02_04165 [Bacteroidales bacterium]|jgi:hypothetical protein|nr:hypothetical protein [Bacteroidales bacterium]
MDNKKKARRRYYLHYRLRKTGLTLITRERQILVFTSKQEDVKNNKYATALLNEYGYNLQLTF